MLYEQFFPIVLLATKQSVVSATGAGAIYLHNSTYGAMPRQQ